MEEDHSMNFLLHVTILLYFVIYNAEATSFYCSQNAEGKKIIGVDEGNITTLYQGTSYYGNNMVCKWTIDAGLGKRIQLMVESSDLQYSPADVLCDGYDHVTVREGETSLTSFCGHSYPKFIMSRGQEMTISFGSDESNPFRQRYTGVRMVFKTFAASECPPGWIRSGTACFVHRNRESSSWSNAQQMCNFEQSNLASILTQEEYDTISGNFKTDEKTWIGLNDISIHGQFTWIDRQVAEDDIARNLTKLRPSRFKHCVAANFKSKEMAAEDCDGSKFSFLCKTAVGQPSRIYAIPQETTDKSDDKDRSYTMLVLGLTISLGIVLIIIIVGICIWRKTGCKRGNNSFSGKRYRAATEQEMRSTQPTTLPSASLIEIPSHQPSAPHSSQHVAPPTYEESTRDTVLM